jgi:hypothetical protein
VTNAEGAGILPGQKGRGKMNKDKILEGTLGNLMVALMEESHRAASDNVLISDVLLDLLMLPRYTWKPANE